MRKRIGAGLSFDCHGDCIKRYGKESIGFGGLGGVS